MCFKKSLLASLIFLIVSSHACAFILDLKGDSI